jgi:hypothetical protein
MSSRPPLPPSRGPVRGGPVHGGPVHGATDADADATDAVTALYQAHSVGLIRLAIVMLLPALPVSVPVPTGVLVGTYAW